MKKQASNSNAASNWVWAEYKPTGSNYYPINKKGAACTSCHTSAKDYTRIFDLFP